MPDAEGVGLTTDQGWNTDMWARLNFAVGKVALANVSAVQCSGVRGSGSRDELLTGDLLVRNRWQPCLRLRPSWNRGAPRDAFSPR